MFLESFIVVSSVVLGAFISRWHGGGYFKTAKILKNMAWGAQLGVPTGLIYYLSELPLSLSVSVGLAVTILCGALKGTGHGGGIDLGTNPKEPGEGRTVERLEYIILPLHDKINRRLYDTLLLSITGIAAVLPAAIALGHIDILVGIIVFVMGALKGLAYYIGWVAYDFKYRDGPKEHQSPTKIGELLTGAFMGLSIGIALVLKKLQLKKKD